MRFVIRRNMMSWHNLYRNNSNINDLSKDNLRGENLSSNKDVNNTIKNTSIIKIKHSRYDGTFHFTFACGKCRKSVTRYYKYCPYCGKELDWENQSVYEKRDE